MECQKWASKGIDIKYEVRDNRSGYKAGALKEGLRKSYVRECDYVAIFDADFQPDPHFLWRTVPFLMYNPELALVQARWKFGKKTSSSLMHSSNPPKCVFFLVFIMVISSLIIVISSLNMAISSLIMVISYKHCVF